MPIQDLDTRDRVNSGLSAYKRNPQNRNAAFAIALKGLRKDADRARIVYIRNMLSDAISVYKRKERKQKDVSPPITGTRIKLSRRLMEDAAAHEWRMMKRIPEHDK